MVSQNQLCNLGCSSHRQGWEGRDPGGVCHSGDFHPPPFPAPRTSWAPASPCSVVLPATDVSRCCVAIFPELKQFFLQEDSKGLRLSIHKAYRLRILENPQSPTVIEALKELLGEESSSSLTLPGGDPSTCPVCPAQHAGCCGDAGLVSLHSHYGGLLWWTVFKPSMFL